EEAVSIRNDLSIDLKNELLQIAALDVSMESSDALKLSTRGAIRRWSAEQMLIDNLVVTYAYDAEKLWTLVQPLLPPETLETLKGLEVAGQAERTLTLNGPYPTGVPPLQAIAMLSGEGSVALDR